MDKIGGGERPGSRGEFEVGGQEDFYLEGQIADAIPTEDDRHPGYSSTQHPTEVQSIVAHALGLSSNQVIVQCRRMGGGFGGKECQAALIAAAAAVWRAIPAAGQIAPGPRYRHGDDRQAARLHRRLRGRFRRHRPVDRAVADARIAVRLFGRSFRPCHDRAMFHFDNAYYLEHVEITSHRCKTHTVSNTAFRGFGGPQGMMVIEAVMDDIAAR